MSIICSRKFILRPFQKGDEDSLIKHINNKEIARNTLRIPYPYTLKDARSWIAHNVKIDRKRKKTEIHFAIDINGKVVGAIGLHDIEGHQAEIGYWLGKQYSGEGIMTSAVKLVSKYAFSQLGLARIYAFVFLWNKASASVLEKAGFKYEGRLRKSALKEGKFKDSLLFAKVK